MTIKLTSTQKVSVLLGIIALGMLGGVIYYYSIIWSAAIKVQENKQTLSSEQESLRFLAEIQNQIPQIKAVEEEFDSRFIETKNPVNFIELIEKSARRLGVAVTIQTVSTEEGVINKSADIAYNHIVMTIRAEGSWENIQAFLKHFQNMPHHIDIGFMNVSKIEGGWSAEISFKGAAQ